MRTRKNYRLKSRSRFTIFIVFIMLIMVTGTNSLLGLYDASSLTVHEYLTVEISSGDTLWQIAQNYMPDDMDVRQAVHKLCQLNDTSPDQLQPGQTIKVPIYD